MLWRMLTAFNTLLMLSAALVAQVCWRMLAYAGVCWRMLTYADVC
jgi:hypothetical protein